MILPRLLVDEPEGDEACLARSLLDVIRRAEELGLDRLALILREAYEAAQAAAEPGRGGSLH